MSSTVRRRPLACELTAWAQLLALHTHRARRWEPERLRLPIFSLAGRLACTGRRTVLHLPGHAPWAELLLDAITTLRAPRTGLTATTSSPQRDLPRPVKPAPTRATSAELSCPSGLIRHNHPSNPGSDRFQSPPHPGRGLAF